MATFSSIKAKIQGLIDKSNAKTGESDTDLTSAVDKLIYGYGGIVIPDGYLKPSGIKEITENGTHNVAKYESIDVNVAGGSGECSGEHVITVDELPTENINENSVYKTKSTFIGVVFGDNLMSSEEGCYFHLEQTKPTENIQISDITNPPHFYYIVDENDVFIYGDIEGSGNNEWCSLELLFGTTFGGFITDVSQATDNNYYALTSGSAFYEYKNGEWKQYSEEITESLAFEAYDDGTCEVIGIGSITTANIVIPTVSPNGNRVVSIGNGAFEDCAFIESITIPDSVTSIGRDAFNGCASLKSITIPDSVTSIGGDAFNGCASLKSITIPDSVTSIEMYTFFKCYSLTSVTIGVSVTSIGYAAFFHCTSLKSITFGNNSHLEIIGESVFFNCSSLNNITLPDSVTHIYQNSFGLCITLDTINFEGSVEQWNSIINGVYWKGDKTPVKKIICSDETIYLQEAIPSCLGNWLLNRELDRFPCNCQEMAIVKFQCKISGVAKSYTQFSADSGDDSNSLVARRLIAYNETDDTWDVFYDKETNIWRNDDYRYLYVLNEPTLNQTKGWLFDSGVKQ